MTAAPPLPNVADVYPLSPMQEGMLFHTITEREPGVFINQISVQVNHELDPVRFQRVWDDLVRRHEVLRTAFVWDGMDTPVQVVRQDVDLDWRLEDLTSLDDAGQEEAISSYLKSDRERGIDPARAPLMRMALFELGGSWHWIWTHHHMSIDGWSVQLLMDQAEQLYEANADEEAEEPDLRYRDYIEWLANRDKAEQQAYWTERLRGYREVFRVDAPGLPVEPNAEGYDSVITRADNRLSEAIEAMARSSRATASNVVASAWAVLLSRWAGHDDVVFGATISGRPSGLPGVEDAVGLFINTLPLRVDLDGDPTVKSLVRQIRDSQLEVIDHQSSSLAEVQRWSEVGGGKTLFETIFVFQNIHVSSGQDPSLDLSNRRHIEQSNYPLALLVFPGEELRFQLVYDRSRLSRDAVASISSQLIECLRQMTAGTERIADISLIPTGASEEESTDRGPDLPVDERRIHDLFTETVSTLPDAPAVTHEGESITYSELDRRSSEIAGRIAALFPDGRELIGVHIERSIELIVGLLGVIKAGCAYVPLDPSYPVSHLRKVVEDEGIGTILQVGSDTVFEGSTSLDIRGTGTTAELPDVSVDDLVYLIHTSGSTGRPKGVMVTHRNLVASTMARMTYYDQPVGSYLLLSSFAFDSSVAGIFWTLSTGGTLVLPRQGQEQDVESLSHLIEQEQVTHLLALPALYETILEGARSGSLGTLSCAIVAGEACPPELMQKHMRTLSSSAGLYNEYGPTEATVWATAHKVAPGEDPVPIGRPIPGAAVRIVDRSGHPRPKGFGGELLITGRGLTSGYRGLADQTKSAFIEMAGERWYRTGDLASFDRSKTIVFLGRADRQLKIRGHRVEAGAVESALRRLPGIEDAAVMARSSADRRGEGLVGYVTGIEADPKAAQADLRKQVPDYMVPGLLVRVEEIPHLPNGKVDYGGLPEPTMPDRDEAEIVPPATENERVLAEIWADLLGHDNFGVHDDFFAMGGDSILTIQMVSRAKQAGVNLNLEVLVSEPTIRSLASESELTEVPSVSERKSLVRIQAGDSTKPLVAVHAGGGHVFLYRDLARHLGESQTVYGLEPIGLDGAEEPIESIPEMARRYLEELKEAQPEGPYRFVGYCMGGAVSLEMARQLEDEGEEVELLTVIDSGLPREPARVTPVSKIQTQLSKGGLSGLAGFLFRRAKVRWRRLKDLATGGQVGRDRVALELVQRACRRAFQAYHAPSVTAPVNLIRSTEFAATPEKEYHMRWGEVTTSLTTSIVDSEHRTILEEPSVSQVADILRPKLQRG